MTPEEAKVLANYILCDDSLRSALDSVVLERKRQDDRWGRQDHEPAIWLAILVEEVGEMAQAIVETHFDNGPEARKLGGIVNIRKEAVQVAAVAVAMIEHLDRLSRVSYGEQCPEE